MHGPGVCLPCTVSGLVCAWAGGVLTMYYECTRVLVHRQLQMTCTTTQCGTSTITAYIHTDTRTRLAIGRLAGTDATYAIIIRYTKHRTHTFIHATEQWAQCMVAGGQEAG